MKVRLLWQAMFNFFSYWLFCENNEEQSFWQFQPPGNLPCGMLRETELRAARRRRKRRTEVTGHRCSSRFQKQLNTELLFYHYTRAPADRQVNLTAKRWNTDFTDGTDRGGF